MTNIIEFKKKQSPALVEFKNNDAKVIVSISQSGEVTIGAGFTANHAAKQAAEVFFNAYSIELLAHINGVKP
jgi:hypothetical protein